MPPLESGWELLAFAGSILVILGVVAECVDLLSKCSRNEWCVKWGKRVVFHQNDRRVIMLFLHRVEPFELLIEVAAFVLVVAGLSMELWGSTKALLASDEENRALQKQVGESKQQLAILNNKTLELAHLYDLSTNALAEANARLVSVRPLKERLAEWFDRCDMSILQKLRSSGLGSCKIEMGEVDYLQLALMLREPGSQTFCEQVGPAALALVGGGKGNTVSVTVVLKPALVR
jgi:hypothetical protein